MNKVYANRAVTLINERCAQTGRGIEKVLYEANIPYFTFRDWAKGKYNPTAPSLECMALAGFDVIYILTGERSGER